MKKRLTTVKDMDYVIHKVCPRCKSKWENLENKAEYIVCTNCEMIACLHDVPTNRYFLTLDISIRKKGYSIYWFGGGCLVSKNEIDEDNEDKDIHLPTLPFDISAKRLSTYLVFS